MNALAAAGAVVIDNSSCWRYNSDVPLIVPEVNADAVAGFRKKGIIANPNCSTAQLVVVLKPLHDKAKITRVVVATYQSVSGAGKEAMDELFSQTKSVYVLNEIAPKNFSKRIASVSRPLMRMTTSRVPNPPAATASATCCRAAALPSGATKSSRSRMTASAGSVRAFSMARALEPGMYSTLRRGRMAMLMSPSWSALAYRPNGCGATLFKHAQRRGQSVVRGRGDGRTRDALALPTTPIVAPTIAEVSSSEGFTAKNALVLRNPAIANFFDLCAISLPLPRAGGLPVGLMLVARNGHDRRLFRVAAAIERLFAG